MRHISAPSLLVVEIEYVVSTQSLDVSFADGNMLRYHRVPRSVYEEIRSAGSLTQQYLVRIKCRYAYSHVEAYRMAA